MSVTDELGDTLPKDSELDAELTNLPEEELEVEPPPPEEGTEEHKDGEHEEAKNSTENNADSEKPAEGATAETAAADDGRAEADDILKNNNEDDKLLEEVETLEGAEKTEEQDADAEQAARIEADERSIFVKNVHFKTTQEELTAFFEERTSGHVKRVTFMKDKIRHEPNGIAYVEFESADSVEAALEMNGSEFKGRKLEVKKKRTNDHRFAARGRRDRMMRGGYPMPMMYPYGPYPYAPYPPFSPYSRSGRGGYRGH